MSRVIAQNRIRVVACLVAFLLAGCIQTSLHCLGYHWSVGWLAGMLPCGLISVWVNQYL